MKKHKTAGLPITDKVTEKATNSMVVDFDIDTEIENELRFIEVTIHVPVVGHNVYQKTGSARNISINGLTKKEREALSVIRRGLDCSDLKLENGWKASGQVGRTIRWILQEISNQICQD